MGPKITSKTYYIYLSKSLRLNLYRRTWLSFLILTIILTPIVGLLWNPQNNTALADTAIYGFAKGVGGTGFENGYSVSLDSSGNIYTTGAFQGTADFDPGAGTSNLVSAGSNDIFILKLDSDGDFVWAKSMGGTSSDVGNSISIDSNGDVYATGYFNDTADFDPGAGTSNLVSAGSNDIFILKLDSDGDFVWAKSMGGTSTDVGNFLSIDSDDNIYTTGYFQDTVDFDPGAGTSNLVSGGLQDVFILKLDLDGELVWAKSIGGTGIDIAQSLYIDSDDDIYTVGRFASTVDFDPGAGTSNLASVGGLDVFILKLDTDGEFVLAKAMGGAGNDIGNSISIGSDGGIYTAGQFTGTADFDPGAGTSNLVSAGSTDIFISKLDTDGDFVWAKSVGGTGGDTGTSLGTDSSGNVYTTGGFSATVDFDPGAGTSNLVSAGTTDIFILKLDSGGDFVWVKSMGGTGDDYGNFLKSDSSGNIYINGYFSATVDFDPGAGTSNLVSVGNADVFIFKLIQVVPPTVATSEASGVSREEATLNGDITSTGGEDATERGFEYGLTNGYGTTLSQTDDPYSTGAFFETLTELPCSTQYYFRAYATNSEGTAYGSETTFSTLSCTSSGSHSNASQAQNQSPVVVPTTTPTTPTIDLLSPVSLGPSDNPLNPKSSTNSALIPSTERFLRNMGLGSTGEDVKKLQQFLNINEYVVSTIGAGATNQETTFFGPRTKQAVKVFQEYFASQILTPLGLTQGTGYFGESTRAFVNSLLP